MSDSSSSEELSPRQKQLRSFKQTALGMLITSSFTRNPSELLTQKRIQIEQLNSQAFSMHLQNLEQEEENQPNAKNRYYKMPIVKRLPSRYKRISPLKRPSHDLQETKEPDFPEIGEVFWSKIDTHGWIPETRQSASLTEAGSRLYLIGGTSRDVHSDINVYYPSQKKWEKIKAKGIEADPRFGHTAVELRRKIVVYGGETSHSRSNSQLRECLNEVKAFSIDDNEWIYIRTTGVLIQSRKNHCAAVVGKHMLIYGGLNQKNKALGDVAVLNMKNFKWKALEIAGQKPKETAFHACATVLNTEQLRAESIYNIPTASNLDIKIPGIYIFGGVGDDRKPNNDLWILNVGGKTLSWTKPVTTGEPPSPRFQHSMAYNDRAKVLCVFGGRIDTGGSSHYTCFNDIHILKLDNLMWATLRVFGNIPASRSGHSAACAGTKLFIFGGVSNTCFCNSDLYVLELNQKAVRYTIEEEERKKQQEIEMALMKERKTEEHQKRISPAKLRGIERPGVKFHLSDNVSA
ncbi:unnamed protein product [Blepharisma stoltei]|uniref:Kelch repeat-containing protein n=1 Tax=Blepharisma stoltei TaxID=1481888 RepID=A0AAU9K9F9_9CILI|nr:unnamed protein product [Blepharisma stoltei]